MATVRRETPEEKENGFLFQFLPFKILSFNVFGPARQTSTDLHVQTNPSVTVTDVPATDTRWKYGERHCCSGWKTINATRGLLHLSLLISSQTIASDKTDHLAQGRPTHGSATSALRWPRRASCGSKTINVRSPKHTVSRFLH